MNRRSIASVASRFGGDMLPASGKDRKKDFALINGRANVGHIAHALCGMGYCTSTVGMNAGYLRVSSTKAVHMVAESARSRSVSGSGVRWPSTGISNGVRGTPTSKTVRVKASKGKKSYVRSKGKKK